MKTLTTNDLCNVNGGASKNTELTTALSGITSSLSDLKNNQKNSGGFDSTTMLMMAMMMSQRSQGPTVVAAGAAPAAPSGPVVNISTRVRRW